ncbi:hypothetical protein ACGFNU_01930 [Spirillospora sp. NPDC048911]
MGKKDSQQEKCDHDWSNWTEEYVSEDQVRFVRSCTKCWAEERKG